MTSLAGQTYAFMMTILAGGVVGLLFDVYRVFRSLLRPKQLATALTDLLYWIVVTPTVFALLLAGNWGELRFYVLIGLCVGLLLYFQTLSPTVVWGLMGLFKGVGRALGGLGFAIMRVAAFPFILIGGLFGGGAGRRYAPASLRPRWRRRALWARPAGPKWGLAWQRLFIFRLFDRLRP